MKCDAIPPKGRPHRILSHFQSQKGVLLAVTVFGLIYNIGLLAGPWFEVQLARTPAHKRPLLVLDNPSVHRTVLSISHRLYRQTGARQIRSG